MYNDGIITNEFTGEEVGGEWVYPTAEQDAIIKFSGFYLSAQDGDIKADGLSFHYTSGSDEDLTVGNATSAVLSATMLNPDGLMDSLTWGDGAAYIGVATSKTTYTLSSGRVVGAYLGGNSYQAGSNRYVVVSGGSTYTKTTTGEPMTIVVDSMTGYGDLYTTTKLYHFGGSSITESALPSGFMADKYGSQVRGIILDVNGLPAGLFTQSDTSGVMDYTIMSYVPMGIFDFSDVDAFGVTFGAEAYDKMTLFDADATDWVQTLDFTSPKTIATFISELMTEMGMTATVSASAVNTTVAWPKNPINSYSVTYRQVLSWLAEAIGCNVRMGRTGSVEFYPWSATSVDTITPATIISNTRTKSRYTVPAITQVVAYNTLGAGYTYGTSGSTYYIAGNPFVDASASTAPLQALLGLLDDVAAYNATSLSVACADPRYDIGDTLTITDVDGLTTYNIPLMEQTVYFGGGTRSDIIATGRQVRSIPEDMQVSNLASEVNSNPAAVIAKVEAEGISADWITTGKLTVLDANNDVLFEADKDNESVQIGGFTVEDDRLEYDNAARTIRIDNAEIYTENKTNHTAAYMWPGMVGVQDITDAHTPTGILNQDELRFYTMVNIASAEYGRTGATVKNLSDQTTVASDSVTVTDGTSTFTASPTGLSFTDGTNPASMRMYTMVCASSTETTQTKTLPAGAYVIYHWRNRAPTQGSTGIQFAVIGESSYQSIIEIGGSGTHVTHDSTMTGTRSYCNVVSAGDGTGTLTWTASGLTNRMLTLVRLW